MYPGTPKICIRICIKICIWEPPPPGGLIPCRCHVTVIVVQHDGRLDVVVQNCGHLREGKVGFRRSRNLSGFSTALDWTVPGCTWPRHATLAMERFTTGSHQRRVCFWDEFDIGGGPPPRPPKICIIMYSLVYIIYLDLLLRAKEYRTQEYFSSAISYSCARLARPYHHPTSPPRRPPH